MNHKKREAARHEREALAQRIQLATRNLMFCTDDRSRADMDRELTTMRDALDALDARLAKPQPKQCYSREELRALADWWKDFERNAVSLPVNGEIPAGVHFFQDPLSDGPALLLDARIVNERLHQLGCRVRLRWETSTVTTPSGRTEQRHRLVRRRLQLGQPTDIQCKAPPAVGNTVCPVKPSVLTAAVLARIDRLYDGLGQPVTVASPAPGDAPADKLGRLPGMFGPVASPG